MKTVNVLVTGVGGPIAQGIMMGLKEIEQVRIIGADRRALTSGHHFCDATYQIPRYTDLAAYKQAILKIIADEEIVAVFPGLPPEVGIYDAFRTEIPAAVAIPESDHFKLLENKVATYKLLKAVGLEKYVPEHYSFTQNTELRQIMDKKFPHRTYVVVKPAENYGAIGTSVLTDRDHFLQAMSQNKKKYLNVEDYYDMVDFEGVERLVMPFLDSKEHSVDIYMHEGEVIVAVPRERTGVSNGIVLEGKVVCNEELIQAASEIARELMTTGFMNIQFFETETGYKLTDVNPRFAGSQVMSLGAGVNFPSIFLHYEVFGERLDIDPKWDTQMFRYRVPKFYHHEEAVDRAASSQFNLNENPLAKI